MANAKIILDKRRENNSNTFPLVIQLAHQGKTRLLPLNLMLRENQWEKESKESPGKVINHINAKRETNRILKRLSDVSYFLTNNESLIKKLDIGTLKAKILKQVFGEGEEIGVVSDSEIKDKIKSEFLGVFGQKLCNDLKATNNPSDVSNANWYEDGINSFKKFNGGKDIQMIDITSEFLEDYKSFWMEKVFKKEAKINTLSARLRAVRAIMNKARKAKPVVLESSHKPFEEIKIPAQEANKRAVDINAINKIRQLYLEEGSFDWHQRNYFLFMFNNRGMNFVDLASLKVNQINNGRLSYYRSKTRRSNNPKEFNLKQTEEGLKILAYYLNGKNSEDYVFPILTNALETDAVKLVKVRKQALKDHNAVMKRIGAQCGIDKNITSYVVRHSWANIAKTSGASTEQIKDALGQSNVIITETYLGSFEDAILDDLNKHVTSSEKANAIKENDNLEQVLKILKQSDEKLNSGSLNEAIASLIVQKLMKANI
ncbi:MAG: site-specific integrase [Sporocytophaga sp.]|nr:site-specific integrase [Sporocytophaga sp.]